MERAAQAARGGIRRKLIAAGGLVVLITAIAIPIITSGAAPFAPSNDINDYTLYAYSNISLKPGAVINGNVAAGTQHYMPPANCAVPSANDTNEYLAGVEWLKTNSCEQEGYPWSAGNAHIKLCNGPSGQRTTTIQSPYYVVAPSMDLNYSTNACQVNNAYTRQTANSLAPIAWIHVGQNAFTAPNIIMPPLPASIATTGAVLTTCATAKPLPAQSLTTTLAPGTYTSTGDINALKLGTGPYTFCGAITIGQYGQVITQSDTVVNFGGDLHMTGGDGGQVGSDMNTRFNVFGAATFGRGGHFTFTLLAPNTDVALGNGSDIDGRVWAEAMHSDFSINVQGPPTTTTTTTTTSSSVKPTTTSTSTTPSTTTTTVQPTTTSTTVQPPTTTTTTVKPTTTTTAPPPPPTTTTTVKPTTTTTTVPF